LKSPKFSFDERGEERKMERTMCVLDETKECDGCMECEVCDLDPSKVCDNCGKCLEVRDFATIAIDRVLTEEEGAEYEKRGKRTPKKS